MPALLRHRITRFILGTAAIGSFTDWVLFATLVVTVDRMTGGSSWATALVLVAKIAPAVVFAPLAARRVDRRDLARSLRMHESLRVGAVAVIAAGFGVGSVPLALAGVVMFEYAAAMQAASRESVISRHIPSHRFTAVNTITAVLSYGLLPVGALLVQHTGTPVGWLVAVAGYLTVTTAYVGLRLDADAVSHAATDPLSEQPARRSGLHPALMRTTAAAALGLMPAIALFTLGPDLAEAWAGHRTATGGLYLWLILGGAAGFVLANLRRVPAEMGLLVTTTGLVVARTGAWQPGLLLLGIGAGAAYLCLQTRLQHEARDPSQFAAAFAVLKIASAVAVVAAPVVASARGLDGVLTAGATVATAAVVVSLGARRPIQQVIALLVRATVRITVVNPSDRVDTAAVVVSNHPHWLDGAVAKVADRSLRPIARWQRRRDVRAMLWIADAVITTAGTSLDPRPAFEQAADHLRRGGRVWLAPEGGSHQGKELRPPRSGAVRMAAAADVPIQPLAIRYERHQGPDLRGWRPWRRPRVDLVWGTPVDPTGDVDEDNGRMMTQLSAVCGLAWSNGAAASMPLPEPVSLAG